MLGMLAIRPWTTYELAKHMDRSLGQVWPRARSHLFNEPKKLVAHGLADASEESVGRRPRTVYTITPQGRKVLRKWLATPGEGPVLEFEQLLKVFLADQGTKDDALAGIRHVEDWAEERSRELAAMAQSYLAGTIPFPERTAILAIRGRFLADFADMVGEWARWAADVMETWPDDPRQAEPAWDTIEKIARRNASPPLRRIGPPAARRGQKQL
jgi:DNA-binding PadR family transcriptional regulator